MNEKKAPTIKNGKVPLAQKTNPYLTSNVFNDILYLDAAFRAELEEQGLQPKWLDAQETIKNGGYDPEGWTVYKRKPQSDTIGLSGLKFGEDPTGVVRRGSLILGVMQKEQYSQLQEALKIKAERLTSGLNKKAADQLRRAASQAQIEAEIHEGYEDNE